MLAIDPGVTTGYAFAVIDEVTGLLKYYPHQMVDDIDDLWRRLILFKPRHVIIEDFDHRGKARTGLNYFPVQLIGVTRLWSLITVEQTACHLQKAATGKAYYTDNLLKQMSLYVRGKPHAMDASRHLLQWFTFGSGYQYNKSNKTDFASLLTEIPLP